MFLKVNVPNPSAGQLDQRVPIPGKGKLKHHAEDSVVVVLDLAAKLLPTFKNQGINRVHHWRPLIPDISRRLVLGADPLQGSGAGDFTQPVKPYLLADI